MTREDRDSLVETLAKVSITETRGSLLSAIGNLLRVLDNSVSSIMLPTLLKDKCEFDADEMLMLAKILKASILGHNDLVEFYMSESSSQYNLLAQQKQQHQSPDIQQEQQQQQPQLQLQLQPQLQPQQLQHHQRQQLNSPSTKLQSTASSMRSSVASSSVSNSSGPFPPRTDSSSIDSNNQLRRLSIGDSDATIRLLLQIEQLKRFIPQVTGLFENILEVYRDSVETIHY